MPCVTGRVNYYSIKIFERKGNKNGSMSIDMFNEQMAVEYAIEDAVEDAKLAEEYDIFFKENAKRKDAARVRHMNSIKDKKKRIRKADRKAIIQNIPDVPEGYYWICNVNWRGACNFSIVEKKRHKRTLIEDLLEYKDEICLL